MIVSGLNENESQEREQGGIMWREIEFHLYRVHLLTLRFLGGNGAQRPPHTRRHRRRRHTSISPFSLFFPPFSCVSVTLVLVDGPFPNGLVGV